LGILWDRSFRHIGGTKDTLVDLYVIASSCRDPKQEVWAARCRDELYARLSGVAFVLPPLRDRLEDIVPFRKRFILHYGAELSQEVEALEPKVITLPSNILMLAVSANGRT